MEHTQVEQRLQGVHDDDVARLGVNPTDEHMDDFGRLFLRPPHTWHELRQVPPHFVLGGTMQLLEQRRLMRLK